MRERRFGPRELYEGSRFLAPLSEEALLEAGRAAGLHEGATLVEADTGNGCAAIFLAEAFHLYARGFDADAGLLEIAQANAGKSPARQRIRFSPPGEVPGPFDFAAALRVRIPVSAPSGGYVLRAGGRVLLGRLLAPESLGFAHPEPPAGAAWRREATPLEWERFLAPLELAIRPHRGDSLAEEAARLIEAFRAHPGAVRYEVVVVEG